MPAKASHIKSDFGSRFCLRHIVVAAAALGTAVALAGCSGGDLGRVRASALNDDMHSWIGEEATGSLGRAPSDFQLTDNEHQLRDLAYQFIEPPHSRPDWKSVFGDYDPIAAPWQRGIRFDRTAYGRRLIDEPHRSQASRYAQLTDDARDDLGRLDPFFAVAARVSDLDGKRRQSLQFVSGLSPRERNDALARIDENKLIVQWVQQCLQQRISSYRWALERLVIHAPDSSAANADRLITQLAFRLSSMAAGSQLQVRTLGRGPSQNHGLVVKD